MAPLKALVFDLDDTLYPETAYVRSGFRAVAAWLGAQGVLEAGRAFEVMWSAHLRGDRGRIFNGLLEACGGSAGGVSIARMVDVYRSHEPAIAFYEGIAPLLDEALARGLGLALISDGYLEAQRRKVQALGLSRWFDPVLLTDQWGREAWKPAPRAFQAAQLALDAPPEALVYIGNNPTKDFQAPRDLGWHTLQLVLPDQLPTGEPLAPADFQVGSVAELHARLLQPGAGRNWEKKSLEFP